MAPLLRVFLLFSINFLVAMEPPPTSPSPLSNLTLSNRITTGYRDAGMVEITGNEQSLSTWYQGSLHYRQPRWGAHLELAVIQDLSLKGRVSEQMMPPRFLLQNMNLHLEVTPHFRVEAGVLRPLTWQFPLTPLAPPVVFQTGTLPSGALTPIPLLTGWRDVPIPYAGAIPWTDTGFVFTFSGPVLQFRLGYVNGEEGLDANSSPSVSFDFRGGRGDTHLGLSGQFGEIGSVPVKEWKHQILLYGSWRGAIRLGFNAFFYGAGIRATNALASSNQLITSFGYRADPFGPFSIAAEGGRAPFLGLDASLVPGAGAVVWFEIPFLPADRLTLSGHGSVFDPDILSDVTVERQMKWRASARLSTLLFPGLSLFASYTWTADPVFLNPSASTPVDREVRAGHPLVPQDILLGLTGVF